MKDSAVKSMLISQYGWDRRDIDVVELLAFFEGETEFVVRHIPRDERTPSTKLHLTIKIEEFK